MCSPQHSIYSMLYACMFTGIHSVLSLLWMFDWCIIIPCHMVQQLHDAQMHEEVCAASVCCHINNCAVILQRLSSLFISTEPGLTFNRAGVIHCKQFVYWAHHKYFLHRLIQIIKSSPYKNKDVYHVLYNMSVFGILHFQLSWKWGIWYSSSY